MESIWAVVAEGMSAAPVVGVAQRSGLPVEAYVFGDSELANRVASYGVSHVHWWSDEQTLPETLAMSLASRAKEDMPTAVVSSDQATSRVLLGAIAVVVDAAVAHGIISVAPSDGGVKVERYVADAEAVEVLCAPGPVVCTIADGVAEAEPAATPAPIEEMEPEQNGSIKVLSTNEEGEGANGLQDAERVVGVGLGVGSKENVALAQQLADAIGAEVACTLPLCDNYHWFEHNRVVGTSTQKISPRLYLSFGSSGAPQHMTGVRAAKVIVAVNTDPEAPIFRECTYGIVGDVSKVLPAFIQAVSK